MGERSSHKFGSLLWKDLFNRQHVTPRTKCVQTFGMSSPSTASQDAPVEQIETVNHPPGAEWLLPFQAVLKAGQFIILNIL